MINWTDKFEAATDYHEFLNAKGNQAHKQRWQHVYDQTQINASQTSVLKTFARQMNVLCMAGAWCGDCVNQCPILQRIADVTDMIDLRFIGMLIRKSKKSFQSAAGHVCQWSSFSLKTWLNAHATAIGH